MQHMQRRWYLLPPTAQRLLAFALVAVLAFTLGIAIGATGRDADPFSHPVSPVTHPASPAPGRAELDGRTSREGTWAAHEAAPMADRNTGEAICGRDSAAPMADRKTGAAILAVGCPSDGR